MRQSLLYERCSRFNPPRNHRKLCLRPIDRDARRESSDDVQHSAHTVAAALDDQAERPPHLGERFGQLVGAHSEIGRHHADDGEDIAVERHGLTDGIDIASVSSLPEAVAQDNFGRLDAQAGFGRERAPRDRSHAKHVEEVRRDAIDEHLDRLAAARHVGALVVPRRHVVEGLALGAPIVKILFRQPRARARQQHGELVRLGKSQRTKQNGIDDGEDGGGGGDAQRERRNRERGKSRRAPQQPNRVADVLPQLCHYVHLVPWRSMVARASFRSILGKCRPRCASISTATAS